MMKRIYKSEVDLGLASIVLGITILPMIPIIMMEGDALAIIIIIAVVVFELLIFSGFRYIVDGDILTVKVMYLIKESYDIRDIVAIESTHTVLASPAASMNRLALTFKGHRIPLIISPKRRMMFIDSLLSVNPNIKINIK